MLNKILPKKRLHRIVLIVSIIAVLLVGGGFGAFYIVKPIYRKWREDRFNNVARELLAKGDYPNALVAARKTLQHNKGNIEAWKLAVEITEKQESPQVYVFQQGLVGAQPTLENKLKFIRVCLKYGALPQALAAINEVGPDGAESAEFFELAAQVSMAMRNFTKAKYHLMGLVKLRPDDNKARLDLAQIRLVDGFADNKPSIRAEIRALANDPALRVRALGLLLADSLQAKDHTETLDLANQLSQSADLTVNAQLMIAEAYRQAAPKRFPPYLEQLKAAYADKPDNVEALGAYLSSNEMIAEARQWMDSLPAKTREDEGVQLAYAALLVVQKEYAQLDAYLRPLRWTENEYARHALLAFAARQRGNERAFAEAWNLAVIEVGNNPRRLQALLARASLWNWPEQRIELLWKRFALDPRDKATRQQLGTWERSKNNTQGLHRLFSRINENDPGDLEYKNNYAYASLLLGTSLDRAYTAAKENYEVDPKNPYYAATYALSLYKQNKPQDALQVLETLGVGSLASEERTLLHGVLLMANGRYDEGQQTTAHLKLDRLLPEERRLYTDAAALAARARRDEATVARLAVLTGASGDAERKSWLRALPAAYRTNSVQMELADSLYANDDFTGLEATLKEERWPENDFLRLALLAYAQRNLGRPVVADASWKTAVTATGNRPAHLNVLAESCERWGWTNERLDVLNRIVQRDPSDANAIGDLVEHYRRAGQTSELARLYTLRVDSEDASPDDKSHFAYYSILTNTNITRAHVMAKQAYDAAPDTPFHAKTYALSLLKQSRPADAWRTLEKLTAIGETGPAQLNLLRAAITLEQGELAQAKSYLQSFDAGSALPEESALADALAKTIANKNT